MNINQRIRAFVIILFLLNGITGAAQDQMNKKDKEGNRHGYWKEYFSKDQDQLKFEGEFIHGKETGLFKFYQEGLKHPAAVMIFDPETDIVEAKYLAQNGKTISEGKLINKERTGLWTYYHKNSDKVMMTENYKNDKLEGEKKTYYEDGAIAEEAFYINGQLHGNRKLYSEKGQVLEDLQYENGELHGRAQFYNGKGELMSEGSYKRNKHHGVWKHYENGKLKEEKVYK